MHIQKASLYKLGTMTVYFEYFLLFLQDPKCMEHILVWLKILWFAIGFILFFNNFEMADQMRDYGDTNAF